MILVFQIVFEEYAGGYTQTNLQKSAANKVG